MVASFLQQAQHYAERHQIHGGAPSLRVAEFANAFRLKLKFYPAKGEFALCDAGLYWNRDSALCQQRDRLDQMDGTALGRSWGCHQFEVWRLGACQG